MMEKNTHAKAQSRQERVLTPIRQTLRLGVLKRDPIPNDGEKYSRKGAKPPREGANTNSRDFAS